MGRVIILLKHQLTFSFISQANKNEGSVLENVYAHAPRLKWLWIF